MSQLHAYEQIPGSVDAMVVFAHPDDELCSFGGLWPHCIATGKSVLPVCMTASDDPDYQAIREAELEQSLWTCGIRFRPIMARFLDCGFVAPGTFESCDWMWQRWGGREIVSAFIQELYHRFRPRVVFTHNHVTGDYGHPNHTGSGLACVDAFDEIIRTDSACCPDKIYQSSVSPEAWGIETTTPLPLFSGQTGWQVANAALACHRSQAVSQQPLRTGQRLELIRTRVGNDVECRDYFEHCRMNTVTA